MGQLRHEIGTRRFDVDHGEALLSSNEREMSLLPLQDREIRFGGISNSSAYSRCCPNGAQHQYR
jgi:hypothetical protein